MNEIKVSWKPLIKATGYLLRLKKLSDGSEEDIDVGNVEEKTLEFTEPDDYLISVYPYNEHQTGTLAEKRSIKVVERKPLEMVEIISPEDGVIVELEETVAEPILLPAILKSPPNNHELNVGHPTIYNLYWYIDEDSTPHLGCYVSIKKNGTLIIDKEDIPIGQTIENHYACDVDFSTSDYEWQVIPYDAEGEAENCPWWNFSTSAQGAQTKEPDTTIGGVESKQATFDLPVTVKSFNKINKFNLSLTYNTTGEQVGELTGITQNPILEGQLTFEDFSFQYGKRVTISWIGEENKELSDDAILFTLHFNNISDHNGGFSQVCWFNAISPNPEEDQLEWYSNDILIDYIVSGRYKNGWINTQVEEGSLPLPLNPVNMTPHQGGGTVYRFVEDEKDILINWMHGNPPVADGWIINVKEDGVLIVDSVEIEAGPYPGETSEFPMTVTRDHDYEFQIIPYNETGLALGGAEYNEWYTFKTETLIIVDSPIATVGTVETNESTTVVPITVENFDNVTGCDLELTYDPAIVTCTHVTSNLPYMFFIGNAAEPGRISIAWIYFQAGDFDGISREDGTVVFELHFSKINGVTGTSPIEFDISHPLYNMWLNGKANEEFNDIPEEDFYIGGSITQEYIEILDVPESVDIVTPLDGAIDVGSILQGKLMTNFLWLSSEIASGYKLYLSETVGFLDDPIDVGNVISKRLELNFNTTYFWKIVPYNEVGDAIDCPVHTFTTLEDAGNGIKTNIESPVEGDETYDLDVTVDDFLGVGAISLTMLYESDVVDVQGLTLNPQVNAIWYDNGGNIKVAWFAANAGDTLNLPPETVLFTLHFNLKPTSKTETTFGWEVAGGMSEYAGYGGTPVYSDAVFNDYIWTL